MGKQVIAHCKQGVNTEKNRNANPKFRFPNFVAGKEHTEQSSDTATDRGEQKKERFRGAPKIFLCLLLICKHKQKGKCIDKE